jgi:FAD/FMN-containing dehydrogenase
MAAGSSWGRLLRYPQQLIPIHNRFEPRLPPLSSMLPYGNGRSYGDVCLNAGGALLVTRGLNRFITFDPDSGVIDCEAGVLLSDLIGLVLPRGWFPAVAPGTAFVTVGGAIANDVHGKNHHRVGSFGHHVLEFELQRSDGCVLRCKPIENSALFRATVGGLGLTGLIRRARIQLRRVPGEWIRGTSLRFSSIDEFFQTARELDSKYEYTAAWIDCSASGRSFGRGIYICGNHVQYEAAPPRRRAVRFPFTPPVSLVNALSLRLFNQFYYCRPAAATADAIWHYQPFLFPLDRILEWNRLYGPRGFLQYQCAVPASGAESALQDMLRRIAKSGLGSFLAVLKTFGTTPSIGLMSFPRPGVTLALDFPNRGQRTLVLLEALDEIVRAAGGAVYPAKDARMSPLSFQRYYPGATQFREYMDPHFSSSFWRRVSPDK